MEEVVKDFSFWINVIQGFFYVIGLLAAWCIFLTIQIFNLKTGLALNKQSDKTRDTAIEEVKELIKDLTIQVKELTKEIHSLELKKK